MDNTQKIGLFPGSFDPFTNGHLDIVMRAVNLLDVLYIGVGDNNTKQYILPHATRVALLEKVFKNEPKIKIVGYQDMTVKLADSLNAKYLVRGLRSCADFEFEKSIALINKELNQEIETLFFISKPENIAISSTIIREIHKNKGNVYPFIPKEFADALMGL